MNCFHVAPKKFDRIHFWLCLGYPESFQNCTDLLAVMVPEFMVWLLIVPLGALTLLVQELLVTASHEFCLHRFPSPWHPSGIVQVLGQEAAVWIQRRLPYYHPYTPRTNR
jgi:hypothetical protein